MKKTIIRLFLLTTFALSHTAFAGFPDDLDDVVFIEEGVTPGLGAFMRSLPVTASLTVDISGRHPFAGQNVNLNYNKTNSWPVGGGDLSCCNANAWGFVKVGDTWYGATWEFLRRGQITKSSAAFVGPKHLRFSPLSRFTPRNGEVYGFMVAGITRTGLARVNVRERSNISLFRFGVGPATAADIGVTSEPDTPVVEPADDKLLVAPAIDLLIVD